MLCSRSRARRVKQVVRWTNCSQSEQGGLLCKRRSRTKPEGKGVMLHLGFYTQNFCRDVNKTNLIGRNCLIFRYARSFDFAQDDKEKLILYAPEMKAYSECTYKRTVRLRRRIQSTLRFACIKKERLAAFLFVYGCFKYSMLADRLRSLECRGLERLFSRRPFCPCPCSRSAGYVLRRIRR